MIKFLLNLISKKNKISYLKFSSATSNSLSKKNEDIIKVEENEYWSKEHLLQRKATKYKQEDNINAAIICLRESIRLAINNKESNLMESQYYRLVEFLRIAKRFDEARDEKAKLDKYFQHIKADKVIKNKANLLVTAKKWNSDYVEMTNHGLTCGECAKYQGRVYSISGKDKRFPKLPDFILQSGKVHEGCHHALYPFFYYDGCKTMSGNDPAIVSNRPFIDDRSDEKKELYDKRHIEKEQESIDNVEYQYIREFYGDICPKTYGAYRRMKAQNSKGYTALKTLINSQTINFTYFSDKNVYIDYLFE